MQYIQYVHEGPPAKMGSIISVVTTNFYTIPILKSEFKLSFQINAQSKLLCLRRGILVEAILDQRKARNQSDIDWGYNPITVGMLSGLFRAIKPGHHNKYDLRGNCVGDFSSDMI